MTIVSVFLVGLLIGNEFAITGFVHPAFSRLPDEAHASGASALARVLGRAMPLLVCNLPRFAPRRVLPDAAHRRALAAPRRFRSLDRDYPLDGRGARPHQQQDRRLVSGPSSGGVESGPPALGQPPSRARPAPGRRLRTSARRDRPVLTGWRGYLAGGPGGSLLGSVTCTSRSAFTSVSICTVPLGQRTWTVAAIASGPSPKCARLSFEDK